MSYTPAKILHCGKLNLQVLDAGGSLVKTLSLPAPRKGFPRLSWKADRVTKTIPGVGQRSRTLGYRPILQEDWGVYDDIPTDGATLGLTDGCRPAASDLLEILSLGTGRLRIGTGAGWITVDVAEVAEINPVASFTENLKVTFQGRTLLDTMTLED